MLDIRYIKKICHCYGIFNHYVFWKLNNNYEGFIYFLQLHSLSLKARKRKLRHRSSLSTHTQDNTGLVIELSAAYRHAVINHCVYSQKHSFCAKMVFNNYFFILILALPQTLPCFHNRRV